jgi:hypothetical protein
MSDDLRTHFDGGRPEPTGDAPKWEKADDAPPCPNCGSVLCHVETPVEPLPTLRVGPSGRALASYLGCPACPFASPAIVVAAENGKLK